MDLLRREIDLHLLIRHPRPRPTMRRILPLFALFFGLLAHAKAQDIAFIRHPEGSDPALSADDVKAVLLGNKVRWNSGGIVQLAVLTAGAAHDKVMADYAQRSADQFDKYWKKQVFTGKGVMPKQLADEAALIDYVATTPGAFGYVSAGAVTDRVARIELR